MTLALAELGGERVLCVEDWAEIRRLHRAERMLVKAIARVPGDPAYVEPILNATLDGLHPRRR